jgi:hypothetical protein
VAQWENRTAAFFMARFASSPMSGRLLRSRWYSLAASASPMQSTVAEGSASASSSRSVSKITAPDLCRRPHHYNPSDIHLLRHARQSRCSRRLRRSDSRGFRSLSRMKIGMIRSCSSFLLSQTSGQVSRFTPHPPFQSYNHTVGNGASCFRLDRLLAGRTLRTLRQ